MICYNKNNYKSYDGPKQWGVEKHLWLLLVWIVSRLGQLNTPFSSWKNVGQMESECLALVQHNQISQSHNSNIKYAKQINATFIINQRCQILDEN